MGNKNGTQITRAYPYLVTRLELNAEVKAEGLNFQPSPYNIEREKFVVRPVMDKEVRDSQFCMVSMQVLSNASKPLIQKYLKELKGFDRQYDMVNPQWRMTHYKQGGHFLQHQDRQKIMPDHKHFGTEIFLPPLSQISYQGGQLKLTYNGKQQRILPDQKLWTHIILPLGISHQVLKVTAGERISYVKEIWAIQVEQPIETDQDRQRRRVMQGRRLQQERRRVQQQQNRRRMMQNRRNRPAGYLD